MTDNASTRVYPDPSCSACGGFGIRRDYDGPVLPDDPSDGVCDDCPEGRELGLEMKGVHL